MPAMRRARSSEGWKRALPVRSEPSDDSGSSRLSAKKNIRATKGVKPHVEEIDCKRERIRK